MTDEQAATQTDDQPKAGAEGKGEQDLDSLLREFEDDEPEKSSSEKTTTENPKKEDSGELTSFVRDMREKYIRDETEKGMTEVTKSIKGDLPIADDLVRGLLEVRAIKNPKIANAYVNRHKNPDAWKGVEGNLRRELKGMIENLSDKSGASKQKVMEAVRNVQTQSPADTPDFTKMNNSQFEQWKRSQSGWAG